MWGSCCFNTGDIKITLGTGSFLNLNTGSQCPASIYGLYPLVAWRYGDKQSDSELVYCMEGAANDTGSIIQWALNFGMNISKYDTKNTIKIQDNQSFIKKLNWQVCSKTHQNQLKSPIPLMIQRKCILYLLLVDSV